ncbi:acyl dehydratase [Microbacterium ginsengiterrae]|uniref:Acyl dehydratase n=1 Tax=Microbacterium ginsengiterrae TaxID=546115 RepID=A0A7W9CB38_9MICO|nr:MULTISPECIES: MaoC/PaaZ C-terminal domain-containing protein [Microbacterium]MBB5742354.1 acyl dehydratase [Microbacterium ginsengiterrae]
MVIDAAAIGRSTAPQRFSWTSRDSMLYSLGVGAGASDLSFVTENSHGIVQRVLPTYAVIIADASVALPLLGDIDMSKLVHGAQSMHVHRPLPVEGAVEVTARVDSVVDKGPGGNAIVELVARALDIVTGEMLVETRSTVVLRGGGGFGGPAGARTHRHQFPERQADAEASQPVPANQALLYRLSGDRNPLHSDPWFARERAGFSTPILHGLCTYGFAGRALLAELCDGDDADLVEMTASFTAPVFPGDTLTTRIWRMSATEAFFRAYARGAESEPRLVLDHGRVGVRATAA